MDNGRIRFAAGLVGLLVAGAGLAAAQEAGAPSPFEEDLVRYRSFFDFGGFEPQLEGLLPEGSASRWKLTAGVASEYSDNADQDGADRYGLRTDGTLGLGWLRRSPRLSGVADYSLGVPIHEEGAYDGEGSARHALAGSLEWQASPRLRWNGAGHVTQNLERGLSSNLSGVRSNYQNRTDEYGARAAYEWQASRTVENDAYYEFSYRDFASDDADGEDTLSHRAGTDIAWQAAPRDGLRFGYAYSLEDQRSGDGVERQNHGGTLGWDRVFLSFPGNRRSNLGVSYTVDRGLFDGGDGGESDYWAHGASATYSWAPSPRAEASVNGGYQWILPDDASDGGGWTYGGRLAYRFTERTDGVVSYGESWEYTATSSTSDFQDLTRVRRAEASLESRLARRVRCRVAGSYADGDVDRDISDPEAADFIDYTAGATLSGAAGESGFWGLGYGFTRWDSDGAEDDYRLHGGDAFYRHGFGRWLEARLSYRFEERDYDGGSLSEDYTENRFTVALSVIL